jgi:hypothetical protein
MMQINNKIEISMIRRRFTLQGLDDQWRKVEIFRAKSAKVGTSRCDVPARKAGGMICRENTNSVTRCAAAARRGRRSALSLPQRFSFLISPVSRFIAPMIARVTLELALRKEFDYLIPPELADRIDVGSRVQVPFGARKVLGCVTALAEESAHGKLKSILKVIGAQTLVTPKILKLARWIGDYYCCAPEIALKSVLPEAVRQEQAGCSSARCRSPVSCPNFRSASVKSGISSRSDANCLCRNCSNSRKPPPPLCAGWKTKASLKSSRRFPNAIPTRANGFCRRNRWR